jgi:hypothetical protein
MTQDPMTQVDRTGRDLVTSVMDKLVDELELNEQRGPDGGPKLPLFGVNEPLVGLRLGEFRVFEREDGLRLVYSALTIDDFAMDTHQIYVFTPRSSAVPHLFLDTAISTNTNGTFHFGLDLVPRVDLGANLTYSERVYGPLTGSRADALGRPGVLPVPSLGPLQWSIRSPWLVAAIVAPSDLSALADVVNAYVACWRQLIAEGVPDDVMQDMGPVDLGVRDARNRAALFSARTNPVWGLLDGLVGAEAAHEMVQLLSQQR